MKDNQFVIFSTKGIDVYKGKADAFQIANFMNKLDGYNEYEIYHFTDEEHLLKLIQLYFEDCLKLEVNQ